MPAVLITPEAMRDVDGPYVALLRKAGFDVRYPRNPHLARGSCGEEETVAELTGIDASIASAESYSATVLEALPDLRVIARCGVGYDRVDVAAATARRVPVTITPTSNHEAVAELTLALMLAVSKSIVANDQQVRSGAWPRDLPMPVRGKTLGVVGLGRIGGSLAARARALGMKVVAFETQPNTVFLRAHQIELVEFDELLSCSDYVSIHCPLNDSTHGMFDKDAFAKMRPGSVFINTARGHLVVEEDLIGALRSGHLRGAGLDVYEQEPPSPDNPLFRMENVVLSPHIAGTDESSLEAMGVEAAECIVNLYEGRWPDGAVVNQVLQTGWTWEG
ncbi:MAG: phosphoglycerate dehydrogenase [Pirellulaceae bacterium]